MATRTFQRRDSTRYSKLGKGRKKKQTWRRPTGRDNKMREKRKGYPARVSIGYRTDKAGREKIDGRDVVVIHTLKELEQYKGQSVAVVLGRMGMKQKSLLIGKAQEMKIHLYGVHEKSYLGKVKALMKKRSAKNPAKKATEKKATTQETKETTK